MELATITSLLTAIPATIAAIAAWKTVNVSLRVQQEQKEQLEKSFLPLFEPLSISINGENIKIIILNRNSNSISTYIKKIVDNGVTTEMSNGNTGEFIIRTKRGIDEQNHFECVITYRTLDRLKYKEKIQFKYDSNKIEIVDQFVEKMDNNK